MRFPTRRLLALTASALLLTGLAVSQKDRSPEAMLRAAMDKETVDGNLKAAIEQYKKVIAQRGASREVVAKALVRLGQIYERQGSAEARKQYERVLQEFADQTDAVQQARSRLNAMSTGGAKGPAYRMLWAGPAGLGNQAVSPDGRYLSFVLNGELNVRDLVAGQTRVLARLPAGSPVAAWSADSRQLAYGSFSSPQEGAQVNIVNLDGTGRRTIYSSKQDLGVGALGWSPDGKRILAYAIPDLRGGTNPADSQNALMRMVTAARAFWIQVADGGVQAIPLAATPNPDAPFALSPDGRYVAFVGSPKGTTLQDMMINAKTKVYLRELDGAGETVISDVPAEGPVGWTPDGKYVLTVREEGTSSACVWRIPVTGGTAQGPAERISRCDFGRSVRMDPAVTRSGALYYRTTAVTESQYIAPLDPATGKITSAPVPLLLSHSEHDWQAHWSPDGRRIVHAVWQQGSTPVDLQELSIYSLDTRTDQRVASGVVVLHSAICWGADGASILFSTPRSLNAGQSDPMRFNLRTGEATTLFPGAASFTIRSCSDDGLVADSDGTSIKVRNLKTGTETEIHKGRRTTPFLSHDGRWVVFQEAVGNDSTALFVVPSEGGAPRELARAKAPARFPAPRSLGWSPDDRFVYFLTKPDANAPSELCRVPAAGGAQESTGLKWPDLSRLDIAPDGKRIILEGSSQQAEIWEMDNWLPPAK